MNQLISEEWYEHLIEELRAIQTESVFNARDTLIRGKWLIGKRILEEKENFENKSVYGKGIVRHIGESLEVSETDIYNCIQFAELAPDIEQFLEQAKEGKNLSWNKVVHNYLPSEKREPEERIICPECGSKVAKSRLQS